MFRLLVRTVAPLAACLALTSCSVSYDSAISGPLGAPTLTFPSAHGTRVEFCLDDLQVTKRGSGTVIWSIATPGDECQLLQSITFGQTPEGFAGGAPATALEEGVEYEVFGRGWTRRGIPWYGGGVAVFRDGAWQDVTPPGI